MLAFASRNHFRKTSCSGSRKVQRRDSTTSPYTLYNALYNALNIALNIARNNSLTESAMRLPTPADNDYLGALLDPSRRRFGKASLLTLAAIALPWTAAAAERQIHDLRGSVKRNGIKVTPDTVIQPGDTITTGSDGYIVFVVGESAFMLRSRSELVIEAPKETTGITIGLLRLVTGALGATFRRGSPVSLRTANATIGIRGTGIYMETRGTGTYFCTCWGKTELGVADAANQREWVEATQHNPRLIAYKPDRDGSYFQSAAFETHTDNEMDMLEKCAGRRAPWIKP